MTDEPAFRQPDSPIAPLGHFCLVTLRKQKATPTRCGLSPLPLPAMCARSHCTLPTRTARISVDPHRQCTQGKARHQQQNRSGGLEPIWVPPAQCRLSPVNEPCRRAVLCPPGPAPRPPMGAHRLRAGSPALRPPAIRAGTPKPERGATQGPVPPLMADGRGRCVGGEGILPPGRRPHLGPAVPVPVCPLPPLPAGLAPFALGAQGRTSKSEGHRPDG